MLPALILLRFKKFLLHIDIFGIKETITKQVHPSSGMDIYSHIPILHVACYRSMRAPSQQVFNP